MEQVDPGWRKASYSGNGVNCVEAGTVPGTVLIRDTTDRDGGTLAFQAQAWTSFTASLK